MRTKYVDKFVGKTRNENLMKWFYYRFVKKDNNRPIMRLKLGLLESDFANSYIDSVAEGSLMREVRQKRRQMQ